MYCWIWEEDAGARPETIRSTYLHEVEACDIYLGLFWLGYGPYTIEEYEYARAQNKHCLIYEKHVNIENRDPQLMQFLKHIEKVNSADSLTVRRFTDAEELADFVQQDVILAVGNQLGRSAFDAAMDPIRAVMQGTHPPRADAEQACSNRICAFFVAVELRSRAWRARFSSPAGPGSSAPTSASGSSTAATR